MRIIRIIFLYTQHTLEGRARSFIWFLMSLFNPLILLLFWRGAVASNKISNWNLSSITSYYFLLVIAGSLLMSHIEEDVAREDIYEGNLVTYILRPFSYFGINFIREIPYRVLQGSMGVVVLLLFFLFFGNFFSFSHSPVVLLLSLGSALLAYTLSFTYKMIVGVITFWVTDYGGIFEVSEMLIWIFSGFVLPLYLFPKPLEHFSYLLPFGYVIYFPISAFQGKFSPPELLHIIGVQALWIGLLFLLYRYLWKKGIRKFTGVGQ